jgi:hypothetical protein
MLQSECTEENYFTLQMTAQMVKADNGNKQKGYMQLVIFYVGLPEDGDTEHLNA